MGPWQKSVRAAASVCALVALSLTLPAHALAADTQESIMMDDDQLIYAEPSHVAKTLQQMQALGVDRVKVSMVWGLVAPNPFSTHRPNFEATDPAAYPRGAWNRYDTVVRLAHKLGIGVYFQLTAPAPDWAVPTKKPTQGYPWSQSPSASQFRQFVQAVGTRYSGTYNPDPPVSSQSPTLLGVPLDLQALTGGSSDPPPADPIPRVDYWGIWNEPNEGAWLNPQWRRNSHHQVVLEAPVLYRGLVDVGWSALQATGHTGDTILIGETASGGKVGTMPFLRALYCVGTNYQPLTGGAARDLSCPSSGDRATFVAQHPGLFGITGYAHHPYGFDAPPNAVINRNLITLAELPRLETELNVLFEVYGKSQPGGVPLYLTEWGYKTNPPNPFVRTSLTQQASWLNQGEFMTWGEPYVRALAQFLLVDDPPKASEARGSRAYWGTFQTGLIYYHGGPKPSYDSYRIPIWLPVARHGSNVTVWGQLRPANHTAIQYALVYFQPAGGKWAQIDEFQTASPRGFVVGHTTIPRPGQVRLGWLQPGTGKVYYSRSVTVY